jgi:hypothetical protein
VFNLSGRTNYAAGSAPFAVGNAFTASITIDPDAVDLELSDAAGLGTARKRGAARSD